jgi:molybdopterin-guanine dinucleotide biosynthesis protein A
VVVLAGGEGRRMGGAKPLRLFRGERLIDRALAFARRQSDTVAVSVRRPDDLPPMGCAALIDDPGIEGPLAGVAAALAFARAAGCEAVLTLPCDLADPPADLAEALARELSEGVGVAMAASGGRLHPACSLWRPDRVLAALPDYLATGRRSLLGLAQQTGFAAVEWSVDGGDPFLNLNTPEELAAAEQPGQTP